MKNSHYLQSHNRKIITNSVLVHVLPYLRKQISGWGGILHTVLHLLLHPVGTDSAAFEGEWTGHCEGIETGRPGPVGEFSACSLFASATFHC